MTRLRAAAKPFWLGVPAGAAMLLIDQGNKAWMMQIYDIGARQPVKTRESKPRRRERVLRRVLRSSWSEADRMPEVIRDGACNGYRPLTTSTPAPLSQPIPFEGHGAKQFEVVLV